MSKTLRVLHKALMSIAKLVGISQAMLILAARTGAKDGNVSGLRRSKLLSLKQESQVMIGRCRFVTRQL